MDIFQENLDRIEKERGKYIDTRTVLIEKYNYDIKTDCRMGIFGQIDRLLIYHDINMVHFIRHILSINYIPDLFKSSDADSIQVRRNYYVRNKHSLFLFLQSVIEAYFRDLYFHYELGISKSFDKILKSVFSHLGISEYTDYYRSIHILNLMRNTLHNNGIYDMPNQIDIEYHGKICSFATGKPHTSASYDILYQILEDFRELITIIAEKTISEKLIKCRASDFMDDNSW